MPAVGDPQPAGDPVTAAMDPEPDNHWQMRQDALDRTRVTARAVEDKREALEKALKDALAGLNAIAGADHALRAGVALASLSGPLRGAFFELACARADHKAARDNMNALG